LPPAPGTCCGILWRRGISFGAFACICSLANANFDDSDIYKYEGVPALFKGLGPTLVGVIPARSINFYTYGNGKQVIANRFNGGQESSLVHLSAAAFAGESALPN
jgi:hypothetical protein